MHTIRTAYLFKYSKEKILKGYSVTCHYKYKFPSELMQLQVISYKRKKKKFHKPSGYFTGYFT